MPTSPSLARGTSRRRACAVALLGLVTSALAVGVGLTAPAQANVSDTVAPPYSQDWSNSGLITVNDNWSGVPGVQGYLGQDITTVTGTDPRTLTGESAAVNDTDDIANQTNPNTSSAGGVAEFDQSPYQTIALQGSGTADAPHLDFNLNLTGKAGVTFSFDARDIDGSTDNAIQQLNVQYRIGASGAFTNATNGYVADATTGPSLATLVTPVSVALPAATDGQPSVFVRVMTTNAVGNDEWVGIDNIVVQEGTPGPTPLAATNPGNKVGTVGSPISEITLAATGGTAPYSWSFTGLPDGITETSDGVLNGTPTTAGTYPVTATVTDAAAPTPGTDSTQFTITVDAAPEELTIAQIQGTGDASPQVNKTVITQGVVTAVYPSGTGELAGFYLQTGGQDGVDYDTPGASDAIFVFMGAKSSPAIGTSVQVKGKVTEFFGTTELSPSFAADVTTLGSPLPAVVPGDTIPGTTCPLPGTSCLTGAALNAVREAHEGELFQPTGDYTVTDSYDGSAFTQSGSAGFAMQGEIGLAAESTKPLMVTTEVVDQSDTAGLAARVAYNDAHKLILDDGSDTDYTTNTNEDTPFPWLTPTHPVRVGAPVTFPKPVILWSDFGFWRIQPQTKVAGGQDGQDRVAIQNTRSNAPQDVLGSTGDLKIATFNMLNYFNTFGEDWAASDGNSTGSDSSAFSLTNPRRCSYYTDRGPVGGGTAARISNDTCIQDAIDPLTGLRVQLLGPRGAANEVNFLRQEAKELEAINSIDADVMSLEEVENSIKLYDAAIDGPTGADQDRDDALKHLVTKLNEHWATNHPSYVGDRWAYAASPRPEALPTVTEQDAIRSAFIYNPSKVELVGRSQVLVNSAPFRNAREPLAQAFKPLGGGRADAFIVIVNHLKSKGGPTAPATVNGDNVDVGDGAGFYNGDRKRQALALVDFAQQVSSNKNIDPVFFTGDFNSYAMEDPIQAIEAAGYTSIEPSNGDTTYSFGGLAGSLDHVFANASALSMVTGEDVWDINAGESVYYEYSRYNANAADLYAVNPFRSSDHNPEIIGIDTGDNVPDPDVDTVQILATNDFHGRLLDDPGSAAAGAASMAGAVKELRAANPDTIFAAAGDLIGASTFESFIQNDEPTIDALNEAGLEVSSVGNHEFDKGYNDLLTRVMPHASWTYLGANVQFKDTENGHTAGDPALPETWCEALPNGRVVGFVGAVTEDLPTLVPASAIEDVVVTDIVDAVNENADKLKGPDGCGADGPADLVVELVHEGAATTAYSSVTDGSTFGKIVSGADENVDAIVSGHTHLAYNHKVPVPAWVTEGRTVTTRPVVSAGQYGSNLNRLQFEFAPGGGALVNIRQTVLQLKDYDADPATQAIVDDAVAFANVQGDVVLGDIANEFRRARRVGDDGQVVENRGGESTLGNLVAEMQRWKTGADIGLMNPGGVRADLLGNDGTPREVTYRQAANTQPFANTLVTMDLTGAQIKILLEQQWQRDADNNIPSRPFLRLGTSTGFTSTFDASRPEGDRITGMWLNGAPIVAGTTYQVSATSFLAGGGDNFKEFLNAHNVQDTGQTDLQAVVDYLAANAEHGVDVLPVDYAQHQVGVKVTSPDTAPYVAGNTVTFTVSSLAMTGAGDVQDNQVEVLLDGVQVGGPAAVTNTLQALPTDDAGTATVTFTLPADVPDRAVFTLHGLTTGTSIKVPVNTSDGLIDTTVTGTDQTIVYGQAGSVPVHVTPTGATGTVTLKDGSTVLGSTPLSAGEGSIDLAAGSLPLGPHALTLVYSGDGTYGGTTGSVNVTVTATPTITATPTPASVDVNGGTSSIAVTVTSDAVGDATGTVTASVGGNVVDTATLSGGSADLTVGPFASIGPKTITIDYSGDPGTEAGSTTTTVIVTKVAAVMTATPAPASVEVNGGTSTITVTVSAAGGPATGSVSVSVGGSVVDTKPLSGGQATVIVGPFSTVGEKTITASYAGNDTTAEASTTTTVTVTERSPTPTSVSATAAAMTYGSAGAVTATVTPSDTTGTVTVRDGATVIGSAEVEGGVAEVTIPGTALEPGNHTLSVTYGGDAEHRSSTTTVVVHVAKAASTTVATASPATVTVGVDTATVTVAVNGPGGVATGQVEARVDGTVVDSAALSEGMATLEVGPFSSVGTQVIEVRYRGSDRLAPSQDQTSVEVEAAPGPVKLDPTIKAFHFPTKVIVDKTRATLTVKVQADGVVPTGWVRVEVPGQDDRVAKLDDGKVKFRLARFGSVGDKVLTITYNGNAEVDSGQIEHVVTVSRKK